MRGSDPATPVDLIWYARVAVVPLLMLVCGYWTYHYFRGWSGLALAAMCVAGFYLPYIVLTPVRRPGELFPLGTEGPALPVGMVIGGAIVGMIAGIAIGIFFGEKVGRWGGIATAAITFHVIYYAAVAGGTALRK